MPRNRWWIPALAAIPACALALASGGPPPAAPTPSPSFGVVFSGEACGYLAPCGCSSPQVGGFPRRGTLLASMARARPLVRIENGDLTEAAGRQDELKAEALADMLGAMGYDALALGEKDLRLGLAQLVSIQSRFRGAILCANLLGPDGKPALKETTTVTRTVQGKPHTVTIVGLLSDQLASPMPATAQELSVEAPSKSLDRLLPALRRAPGTRILVYHGPKAEAEQLVRAYPLFSLVLYAHAGDVPSPASRLGAATLVGGGQRGKHVGLAVVTPGSATITVTDTALGPQFADHPNVTAIKSAYLDRVTDEGLLEQSPRSPLPTGAAYAGSEACRPCHAAPHTTWTASGHARAYQTLVKLGEGRDPDCVPCHVVGLDRSGGFVSAGKTPQLGAVGCEVCHGASQQHVADSKVKPSRPGEATCRNCHVPDHSPGFEFAGYWAKIKH